MRRRRVRTAFVAPLVALTLAASACSGGSGPELTRETLPPDTTTDTDTPAPGPATPTATPTLTAAPTPTAPEVPCTATRPGSRVTWSTFGETASLDPTRSSGSFLGGTEMAAIYDVLVRHDPATGEWVPHLAESLTADDAGTVWTLGLRPDVSFDSGEPLDADAVVASFERFRDPGIRNPARAAVDVVETVEAVDASTVRFTLTRPWWGFPSLLADEPGMIVDAAVVARLGERFGSQPVGAGVGPYRFETWTPGRELVLVARDDWWGGPVCVETLRFVFVPGPGAAAGEFAGEHLDVAYLRGPDSGLGTVRDAAAGELVDLVGSASVILVNHGARGSEPATADPRLRDAVALAVDPAEVVDAADDPALAATTAILHPDQRLWSEALAATAAREGTEDPAADAAALVAEVAGDGGDVTVRLVCPNDRLAEAETIAAALADAGLDVDLVVAASVIGVVDAVVAADYDLACWDLSLSDPTLDSQLRANLSSTSGANRSGFASAELDGLLDALDAARTVEDRRAVVADIGALVADEVPWVPVAARTDALIWDEAVTGIVPVSAAVYAVGELDALDVPTG